MTVHTGAGQLHTGSLCSAATAVFEQRVSSLLGVLVRGIHTGGGGQVRRLPTANGCSFLKTGLNNL